MQTIFVRFIFFSDQWPTNSEQYFLRYCSLVTFIIIQNEQTEKQLARQKNIFLATNLADQFESADEGQFLHLAFGRVNDTHNSHHDQKD